MTQPRVLFPPKGKTIFQPAPFTAFADDSDSEDEIPINFDRFAINEKIEDSIKICHKSLKRARASSGLHFDNPDLKTELQLSGFSKYSNSVFLEVSPSGFEGESTNAITLSKEKKPVLVIQFKTPARPQQRGLDEPGPYYSEPQKYTLHVAKTGGKTVSVPEDVLKLEPNHHYGFRIRWSTKVTKILVNCKEVARVDDPLTELMEPYDLTVTDNIFVKSVHVPSRFAPTLVKVPFKGNMQVGDRINVFGEQRQVNDEEQKGLLTLGDVVVPYDEDNKRGKTRIIIQRFKKSLVAYNNGKAVVTSRTPEKLNTDANLLIHGSLKPTGIWITRMGGR
ncbi:uncharacterized protein LOC135395393 [Ornithodoros turicata]|uniref:uncharacterized protein LOC135395393 n=1 Tax=Ornithodoros turicata TaxID=34597 RepID=UPI00313912C4